MRTFRKLLVANRGEIARRVITTARDMGIATVAVYSDADERAPHVTEADEAVRLPGVRAADTYLDVDRVVQAARRTGAEALHPGYGFLAESPTLADACARAGIEFVGPPPEAMRAMSRKVEAKAVAARVGVPVLPTVNVEGSPPDVDAGGLRFPLLVKASAGGGGAGIREVDRREELGAAIESASRDALAAFGDGTVFLEPLLQRAHHVEVQVLSDGDRTVHLFERECSVQRRHQKLVEEAPSPTVSAELRRRMVASAVALADAVGYVGAGTVEFLVEENEFFFLEMNTRLQVEHRVTESVTGVDLVRAQIEIASGHPLAFEQEEITLRGHAIEARLYAEDPSTGYTPSTGTILHYSHSPATGVHFDDAIVDGSRVPPYYDGLLAKVIAGGAHRGEAAARLARALRGICLDGVVSNRHLLVAVLEDGEFLDDGVDTSYLVRRPELVASEPSAALLGVHGVAAAVSRAARAQARSPLSFVPIGWRNVAPSRWRTTLAMRSGNRDLSIELGSLGPRGELGSLGSLGPRGELGEAQVSVQVEGGAAPGTLASAVPREGGEVVDVTVNGILRRCTVRSYGERWAVNTTEGQSDLELRGRTRSVREEARDGAVTSPVPGTVTSVLVAEGDEVRSGDVVVVIEAMKMEHRLTAPFDGVVEVAAVTVGDVVDAHQVLVTVSRRANGPGAT